VVVGDQWVPEQRKGSWLRGAVLPWAGPAVTT